MELELGKVKFFNYYVWEECDEHIFWAPRDLDICNIKLHEGQQLAYFSREEIQHLAFASHYHEILTEVFDSLAKII